MEICEKRLDDAEFVSGINEDVGVARARADFTACLLGSEFQRANGCRSDGDDPAGFAACLLDFCGRILGDRVALGV